MPSHNDALQAPPLTLTEQSALLALATGDASPFQQRLALKWVIGSLLRLGAPVYAPSDPYHTAFQAGLQFAGVTLAQACGIPVAGDDLRDKA